MYRPPFFFEVPRETVTLPERERSEDYARRPVPAEIYVPEVY